MGLDQWAYIASKANTDYDDSSRRDIAYWRKHPNLHGWMEKLWLERGMPGTGNKDASFNCIELELSWSDIDRLERDIKSGNMAGLDTKGFFFGNTSDDHYREQDLQFCRDARAELFLGIKVFYNSSW